VGSWWGGRVRQFDRYLRGRVEESEREDLATWLTPAQIALFERMHRADQRHGLDVVASLRAEGHRDRDLLLAGLFHDASKGPGVGLWPRVAWALGGRYGGWVHGAAAHLPGFRVAFDGLATHAARSAELCLAAGCSVVTAELVRNQAEPVDPAAGEALRLADEAN
jgi:hypothetical protein